MKKVIGFIFIAVLLTSCTLQSQFNLKSDKTGSFLMSFNFDKEFLAKSKKGATEKNKEDLAALPKGWTNMYDYLKEKKDTSLTLSEDTLQKFKRLFIRYRVENDALSGFDMKMDSIGPAEWDSHNLALDYLSNQIGNKAAAKKKARDMPFTWDGETLIIFMGESMFGEFNETLSAMNPSAKDKKDNSDVFKLIRGMAGNADFEIVYTFVLDKNIKSIKGKHDFIKKTNANTVEMRFKVLEMLENTSKGKKNKYHDDKIVVKI